MGGMSREEIRRQLEDAGFSKEKQKEEPPADLDDQSMGPLDYAEGEGFYRPARHARDLGDVDSPSFMAENHGDVDNPMSREAEDIRSHQAMQFAAPSPLASRLASAGFAPGLPQPPPPPPASPAELQQAQATNNAANATLQNQLPPPSGVPTAQQLAGAGFQRPPMLNFNIPEQPDRGEDVLNRMENTDPQGKGLTDYAKYKAQQNTPQPPRPSIFAGPVPQEQTAAEQDAIQSQSNEAYKAEQAKRAASSTPQTLPAALRAPVAPIPEGMMRDKQGRLVPAATDLGDVDRPGFVTNTPPGEAPEKKKTYWDNEDGLDNQPPPPEKPQMVPAQDIPLVSPKHRAELEAAEKGEAEAIGGQAEAGANVVKAEKDLAHDRRLELETDAKDIRSRARDNAGAEQKYINMMNALSKKKASLKIDPEQYYTNQSEGERVLGWLAGALSAFGSALTHTRDDHMAKVEHAIDRNIMAQRQQIENAGDRINDVKGILAETYRMTGNIDAAEALARSVINEGYKQKAIEYTAGARSEEIKKNGDYAVKHFEHNAVRADLALSKYAVAHVAATPALGKDEQKYTFVGPDGQSYMARNRFSWKTLTEATTGHNDVLDATKAYEASLKNIGKLDKLGHKIDIDSKAMDDANTKYTLLQDKLRSLGHDGVWKKSEAEMLANKLAPPDKMLGHQDTQLAAIRRQADLELREKFKTHDPIPVQRSTTAPSAGGGAPDKDDEDIPKEPIK